MTRSDRMRGPKPPFVGAIYVSARPRSPYATTERWRWEVTGQVPSDLWRLERAGPRRKHRTRKGALLRTTEELRDRAKWRMVGVTTTAAELPPQLPGLDGAALGEAA